MPKCVLCGDHNAKIPLIKDAHSARLLDCVCAACKADVDRLLDLAENADDKTYAEYREGFTEDFGQTDTVKDLLRIADGRRCAQIDYSASASALATASYSAEYSPQHTAAPQKKSPRQKGAVDPVNYYPNKLMLCTLIGLAALCTSILGLIPSVIGFQMAKELPPEVSPTDVLRARRLCLAALIINTVELVAGIITAVVLALTM